ncbi:chain-length determining protein [Prevotella veroralis]|uniref:chain-length determining protein n=1 Tax=Prevotella veroralis TaxID=28137 RepID=UPI0003A26ABF|nr:chain-length determining protein [Prevotella veroralis]
MEYEDTAKQIDLRLVFKKIKEHKKLYLITLPIVIVLSSYIILCVPRTYTSETAMAPEASAGLDADALGDIASSFGFDLPTGKNTDAISPLLYPDLMKDNGFATALFKVDVTTIDKKVHTDYYNYLKYNTKTTWWEKLQVWITKKISHKDSINLVPGKFNPYQLSKEDNSIVEGMRSNIKINTDKRTGIISISTIAQDPMVAKMLADATRTQLQKYIIEYRTKKLRNDVEHYQSLVNQAKHDYEKVRKEYGKISDADMDVVLESVKLKQNDLENDMQLKYNAYTTLVAQLKAADAKLQEHTPVFTTIQGAEVPVKPSGPKRMLFVFGSLFIGFLAISIYAIRDIILAE